MDKTCQYCNKIFSTPSNLRTHLKTSKKCLENRTTNIDEEKSIDIKFDCEFCKKIFLTKQNLSNHIDICKVKNFIKNNSTEIESISSFKEEIKLLKEQQIKYEIELSNTKDQLKSKDEIIQTLQQKLDEKIKIIEDAFLKQSEKLASSNTTNNTTNNNNNTINNYNVQFDKMVEKLLIFSPENIKNSINKINGYDLVYLNDFDGEKNFSSEFVKCVKNLTFCTDTSRGSLIVKKEDGNPDKITSESFVLKCLEDGKQECLQKIDTGIQFLRNEYESGESDPVNSTISVEDFVKCRYKLLSLRDHIRQNGPNEVITSLSNTVVKNVDQLSSKNVRKQNKKLIQNSQSTE
jgi:hypothetical protein